MSNITKHHYKLTERKTTKDKVDLDEENTCTTNTIKTIK